LKLKYFSGRDQDFLNDCEGVAFNLMNQPALSQVLYLASTLVLEKGVSGAEAFEQALRELVDPALASFIQTHRELFLNSGLDKISEIQKEALMRELGPLDHPIAIEIKDWLSGDYIVGPECLTD
jgi:hypothetical protein